MRYSRAVPAVFLDRPNRFIARVELNGAPETVHVKNTGRLRELLRPGAEVFLCPGTGAARKDTGPAGRRSAKRRRILLLAAVFAAEVCAGICSGSGRVRDETAGGPLAAAEACIGEHAAGGLLSDEDSTVLLPLLDERPELWEEDPAAACAACFEAGKLYLYRYTGAGGSFRSRLLLAQPFFERAAALRVEAERREPAGVSETPLPPEDQLESYIRLCGFFLKYVYGGPPLLEPERDEYGQILNAAGLCLAEQTIGTSEDGAYLRLLLYQSIAGLLNEYRQGMAASGIGMEAPAGLLERIREQTEALTVGTERLYRLQQTVAAQCREYEDNMARTYQEVRKWADAGKEEGRNEEQKE